MSKVRNIQGHDIRRCSMIYFVLIVSIILFLSCEDSERELQAVFPAAEWERALAEDLGVDSVRMAKALEYLASESGKDGLDEVFIVRKGYVIYEGDSIHKKHNIYSSSKSFTSTVLGLLSDEGVITEETYARTIDSSLTKFYPEVQLKHFASMTSGYSAVGNSRWDEPSEDWSWTPFAIDKPLYEPGKEYAYWDEAQMMFGRLLTVATGRTLKSIFMDGIGSQIGIGDFEWWGDESYMDLPLNNGCTGVTINAEQLARFGYLYLHEGKWKGQQLLSTEWVRKATRNQVHTDTLADTDRNNVDGRGAYGYNWWVNGKTPSGAYHMPDSPKSLYYASGFNNNMCFVIPEWDMVVVRRGEDGNPLKGKPVVYNEFFKRFQAAISPL